MFGLSRRPRAPAFGLGAAQAWWLLVCGAIGIVACQPSIGDKCTVSTDCSSQGGRLCDTSQPNGYCTAFQCVGDDCPSEAVCILFGSAVAGCHVDDRRSPPRTGRSMCLYACKTDNDCRAAEGYVCADPQSAPYFGTSLADVTTKVCVVRPTQDGGVNYSSADAPVCKAGGGIVADIDASAPKDAGSPDTNPLDASQPDASDAALSDAALDAADAAD